MRTFLITLGFCPNKVFKHTAARVEASLSDKHKIECLFIAKPYPIDAEANWIDNCTDAKLHGYRVIERLVDSGAAGDFNKTLDEIGIHDDDIVIIYDSDTYVKDDGWDDAVIRVFNADPQIDWLCLSNEVTKAEFGAKSGGKAVLDGINIEYCADWMMVGVSAFRGSFLKFTGGLVQPPKYYGGVEEAMWHKIVERGTKQAFLLDYSEDQRIKMENEDETYRKWKTVASQKAFPFSFKEWLEMNGL